MNTFKIDPTAGLEQFQAVANTVKANIESAFKSSSDALTKQYGDVVAKAQAEVEKGGESVFKAVNEINAYGKDNIDAVVASSNVVAKAAEDLNKLALKNAQAGFKSALSTFKSFAAAKSLTDVVELQTTLAKSNYDSFVAEAAKLNDMGQKVAEKASAPIKARVEATVAQLSKPLAA